MGNFRGNDDPGRKFGSEYAHAQSKLLSLLAVVAGEVEGIGDGLVKMADRYGVAEQGSPSNVQSLKQLARESSGRTTTPADLSVRHAT
ncbi:MAG: hypothetical protein FWE35_29285 [Streptosporangiales bacterium]|jgi:hypothetical protein|nr:hypothetical protein [Streptosporangiales bacterium]